MNLEQLKAAMEAAAAEAAKDPSNAELKAKADEATKAYNDAKAAADAGGAGDTDLVDESQLDEKTKAYIAKLRKENADRRTKNKDLASKLKSEEERRKAILKAAGIEDDSEAPEEKVKTLSAQTQQLAFRNAILESAVQHGIAGDDVEYYEFLVRKATDALGEGEELDDETLKGIVTKVKKAGKGQANTSVTNGGGNGGGNNTPPPAGGKSDVTLDKFVRMSMVEKSKLYTENRSLYEALVAEAKAKKKLVG